MEMTIEKPKRKKKPKRRENGAGSVFFKAGKWVGVVTVGRKPSGKLDRRWVRGDTQTEVTDAMTELRKQKKDGTIATSTKQTVAEWLQHWLEKIAPHDGDKACRATTVANYDKMARLYILPHVGGVKLCKLTHTHIDNLHQALRSDGIGNGTIRIVHNILRRAIAVAIRRGDLAMNPCDRVGRPKRPDREMRALTEAEAGAFLRAASSDRLRALYILAIGTGMRQGELFGLKRADIDLDAGTVTVRRTLVHSKGVFVENPPKSKAGNRRISLTQETVKALREHYERMNAEGNAWASYVFCTRSGSPLWRSNVFRKSFRPILEAAGLPEIRFHDLRHTSASIMLAKGLNPKVVAQRLGHDVVTLLKTYAHVLPGDDLAAAGLFDGMIRAAAG